MIRLYSWRPRPTLVEFQALTTATQGRPVLFRDNDGIYGDEVSRFVVGTPILLVYKIAVIGR